MTDNTGMNHRLAFFHDLIGSDMSTSISPLGRWLKGTLREVSAGTMVVDFLVRDDMTNPMGVLHGGAASAIMDEVVGAMVYALGREFAYTSVNLNCDFLNPARLGEVITARARVIRAGRNVIHCECTIDNSEGRIVAKCATNLIQTGLRLPES